MSSRQLLLLIISFTFISWLCVLPRMFSTGTNIVTKTYHVGATRYLQGEDPYRLPIEEGDRFEYSPLFALLYSSLTRLSSVGEACVWALLNCLFFWAGIFVWVREKWKQNGLVIMGLLFCSMELNISVLYQQINSLLTGFILLALFAFRCGSFRSSGILLGVLANIKIYPIVFAIPLIFVGKKRFIQGILLGLVIAFFLPSFFKGISHNFWLHQQWFERLWETLTVVRPHHLDVSSVVQKTWGFSGDGLNGVIFLVTATVAFVSTRLGAITLNWFGFIMAGILLVSPMTESPTFVAASPLYLLFISKIENISLKLRSVIVVYWLIAAFFLTIGFTDLIPNSLWNPSYVYKTLGLFLLWFLVLIRLLSQLNIHLILSDTSKRF